MTMTIDSPRGGPQALPASPCDIDALNGLLRGELSAVETYEQALSKFQEAGTPTPAVTLANIRDEHFRSAAKLRERVRTYGGVPSDGAGVWGVFAALVTGSANLFGPETAIAALRRGEQHGVNEYEIAAQAADLSAECKYMIRSELMPRCQEHVAALEDLIDQMGRSADKSS